LELIVNLFLRKILFFVRFSFTTQTFIISNVKFLEMCTREFFAVLLLSSSNVAKEDVVDVSYRYKYLRNPIKRRHDWLFSCVSVQPSSCPYSNSVSVLQNTNSCYTTKCSPSGPVSAIWEELAKRRFLHPFKIKGIDILLFN